MKRFIVVCVALFAVSCSHQKNKTTQIPIRFVSCLRAPLVDVVIEGAECSLELDLGASCELQLKPRILDQIKNKSYERDSDWFDCQGNRYNDPIYKLPDFKFYGFSITKALATEENEFFITTGGKPNGISEGRLEKQLRLIDGRIGNYFFHELVCFLDLSHSILSIGTGLEEIEAEFCLENAIAVPFYVYQGVMCVIFQTEKGNKTFFLDTGASHSIARRSSFPESGEFLRMDKLQLEAEDLGAWTFFVFDFPDESPDVDGALGMDFFHQFAICLDFPNQTMYLKPRERSSELLSFMQL